MEVNCKSDKRYTEFVVLRKYECLVTLEFKFKGFGFTRADGGVEG